MSTEISTRTTPQTVADVQQQVDFTAWANSLVNSTPYEEPDPGYLTRAMLMKVLTATSPEEIMSDAGIGKLREMVPNTPGANTGPILITDVYVTGSDFGEGMPCYLIITAIDLELGTEIKFTTGASYLQGQLLAMLNYGTWPIKCQIKRIGTKGKGEQYLFQMYPAD